MRSSRLDPWCAVAVLATWVAAAVWLRWGSWAPDLSALLIAGWLWEQGQGDLIYAMPPGFFGGAAPDWAEALAALGVAGEKTYPYVYPPIWAALVAPLTSLWSMQTLMNAALVVQVPLLAGSVLLAGRLARPEAMSGTVWALWGVAVLSVSAPAYLALFHTQPSILMGFVVLGAFERLAAGRPVAFGALIALAAAIKLSPALFILAALMTRSGRAVGAFVAVGAALALASLGLAGWHAHQALLASLHTVSQHTLLASVNISLEAVLSQLWLQPQTLPATGETPTGLRLLANATALGATGVLVWRARTWTAAQRPLGALLGLGLVIWLLGPLGWLHYYVILLLVLPGLVRLMPRRRAMAVGGAAGFVAAMPVYLAFSETSGFHAIYPALACATWAAVLIAVVWPGRGPGQGAAAPQTAGGNSQAG